MWSEWLLRLQMNMFNVAIISVISHSTNVISVASRRVTSRHVVVSWLNAVSHESVVVRKRSSADRTAIAPVFTSADIITLEDIHWSVSFICSLYHILQLVKMTSSSITCSSIVALVAAIAIVGRRSTASNIGQLPPPGGTVSVLPQQLSPEGVSDWIIGSKWIFFLWCGQRNSVWSLLVYAEDVTTVRYTTA